MPKDTPEERRNVRIAINVLHYIAPTCMAYWAVKSAAYGFFGRTIRIPIVLETWTLAESLFYVFIYLPRSIVLQRDAIHPPTPDRKGRREIFELCNTYIPDPEAYLNMWFLGAPKEQIKRANMKDFFLWALWNRGGEPGKDDEELEEYCRDSEAVLKRPLAPGRGDAECLRLTLDKVRFTHRSLLWYFLVAVIDHITFKNMKKIGFEFYRTSVFRFFHLFPARPQTLWKTKVSPVKHVTYWHRPHTSKTRMPVVFLHGVGVGLYPYCKFLEEINTIDGKSDPNDQVGIIAIELMAVSSRLTEAPLSKEIMAREVETIIKSHGWDKTKFVLVSHSYGSVVSSHLLKSPNIAQYIGPVVLIDPVTIALHLPDVAYNFTRRKPEKAFELLLGYFACMDMGISHAMSRHLFWHESILWRHEITGHDFTIALAGKDIIVPTEHVGRYVSTKLGPVDDSASDTDGELQSQSQSTVLVKMSDGIATPMSGFDGTFTPLSTADTDLKPLTELNQDNDDLIDMADTLPTPTSETEGPTASSAAVEAALIKEQKQQEQEQEQQNCHCDYARQSTTEGQSSKVHDDSWKTRPWIGSGIDIMWFEELDHAQAVMKRKTRRQLIDVIRTYSASGSDKTHVHKHKGTETPSVL